jgi:hypothetical protein
MELADLQRVGLKHPSYWKEIISRLQLQKAHQSLVKYARVRLDEAIQRQRYFV